MIDKAIKKLTLSYILIITVICILISSVIYFNIEKRSSELLENLEIRLQEKLDPSSVKFQNRILLAEETIKNFHHRTILNLFLLNTGIICVVGILAYFFARRTIVHIEGSVSRQKEFISNVSHELKTPLTALKSTFEVSLRDKNGDYKETIKSGIEEVDKMNNLINGFLKLSQINTKKYKVRKEIFFLENVIDEIVLKNQKIINQKNIKLSKELSENKVKSDIFLLQELISIFIENAIKFNKTSGEVIIKSYKKDGYDIISIKDTGIGIKEENLNKIFDRFYKIDTSRSQDEGYGIGLSLAREIEEILKCKITVKSEVGKGSEFSIKFSELFQN